MTSKPFWTEPLIEGDKSYYNHNQYGFDKEIVEDFTELDCQSLAIALHDIAGYPIYAVINEGDSSKTKNFYYSHVFVKISVIPEKFLDINGISTKNQLIMSGWTAPLTNPIIKNITQCLPYLRHKKQYSQWNVMKIAEELLRRKNE